MAVRRRVNNLMALAVLAATLARPMYPYEMTSALRQWGKDQDMKIKWGSLYTVVGNLEKHGLLEAAESNRQGRRPERTIYRITDAGRAELTDWTRELIASPEREQPRFRAGLSVLAILPPDEATNLLRQRLDTLHTQVANQREALAGYAREVPRLFLVEDEYDLAIREAELAWIRGLIDELAGGSFPGLPQWRAWHATGHPPPEWAGLAEGGATGP
jgi:DNA-binding PadR family transcriptional regulator